MYRHRATPFENTNTVLSRSYLLLCSHLLHAKSEKNTTYLVHFKKLYFKLFDFALMPMISRLSGDCWQSGGMKTQCYSHFLSNRSFVTRAEVWWSITRQIVEHHTDPWNIILTYDRVEEMPLFMDAEVFSLLQFTALRYDYQKFKSR